MPTGYQIKDPAERNLQFRSE